MESVLKWSFERVHRVAELAEDAKFTYLWTDASNSASINILKNSSSLVINLTDAIIQHLKQSEENTEADVRSSMAKIFDTLKKTKLKSSETKQPNLWRLTRLILIGSDEGPPVAELICLLGKENSIYRLNLAKEIILKS